MDRFFLRDARDGKTEIDLVGVVHAHVEHHEKDREEGDGFDDGFEHGRGEDGIGEELKTGFALRKRKRAARHD